MNNYSAVERRFQRMSFATIIALLLLILAGGIVRSSGSGMGCPDWPKCFGSYIPPTDVSQLPANYQEIYKDHGYATMEFNVVKTWTEYINRLLGAIVGFMMIGLVAFAWPYRKNHSWIFKGSVATFMLTSFQGWIGAKVVSTNLKAWMVTIHMLIALIILALVVKLWFDSRKQERVNQDSPGILRTILWIQFIVGTVQILIGTQVREMVDEVIAAHPELNRSQWVAQIGTVFYVHRSTVWIIVAISAWLLAFAAKLQEPAIKRLAQINAGIVILQALIGFSLAYFSLPPISQALHIFVASMAFALQYYWVIVDAQMRKV